MPIRLSGPGRATETDDFDHLGVALLIEAFHHSGLGEEALTQVVYIRC